MVQPQTLLPTDVVLQADALCNLKEEQRALTQAIANGEHLVVYGRRNTGKTSLVAGIAVSDFLHQHSNAVAICIDLLGVTDMEDLEQRVHRGLERAISRAFPTQARTKALFSVLKGARPKISIDPVTSGLEISLDFVSQKSRSSLEHLIDEIKSIATKFPTLLVMDEFQELALVKNGVASMRTALQNLPAQLPIIILGSKSICWPRYLLRIELL